jgi:hypothetical protein
MSSDNSSTFPFILTYLCTDVYRQIKHSPYERVFREIAGSQRVDMPNIMGTDSVMERKHRELERASEGCKRPV